MAGLPILTEPALIVGVMDEAVGDATPNVPIAIGSQMQADARFGQGTELARMFKSYFASNFANMVFGVGLVNDVGAMAATGSVTITAPPTEAGTLDLYIGAQNVRTNINTFMTNAEIAQAIVDEISSINNEDLPVTAAIASTRSVSAAPTVAAGGTGYTVGNTITLPNGVVLTVATVTAGAVATVTLTNPGSTTGTPPANPVHQVSTNGAGINATFNLTWGTAVPSPNTIALTARWKGINGNDIMVSLNYYRKIGGEVLPTGLGIILPATGFLTGGTGTPTMEEVVANLGENQYDYVALPYTDSDSLQAWEYEYGFSDNGRWGWRRQLYGLLYSCKRGTYADLIDWGTTRNSGVTTVLGIEMDSPSPVYEWAAAYSAIAQRALINDPARPLQTLSLQLIKAAHKDQLWNIVELQGLSSYGIATAKISADHVTPMISRESTTYQLNLYGFSDDAYELVTTMSTLARLIRNQRHAITSKFPRHKLANDGTKFGPGQAIVTPGIIKAELVAEYQMDMWNGLVEDIRNFKAHLLVERDPNDPNRVNVLYPPDLINQLRIFAVLAQFRLQYDRGIDIEIVAGQNTGISGVLPGTQLGTP